MYNVKSFPVGCDDLKEPHFYCNEIRDPNIYRVLI